MSQPIGKENPVLWRFKSKQNHTIGKNTYIKHGNFDPFLKNSSYYILNLSNINRTKRQNH